MGLQLDDYRRYGRQMILDGFGLPGQLKLQQASVIVVGAGGLGCAALQHLAATGIGRIGIIDYDVVELSNLQRQILYNDHSVGSCKATSAAKAITRINPRVQVNAIVEILMPSNSIQLLSGYDIILDCTDNAAARYLLSDTAVILGKPLVSGAAQRYEGQLCIYNFRGGPCYRCLFPSPSLSPVASSCEETGVLGVVPGIIGSLQALEVIKILTGLHGEGTSLLLFSALDMPAFRAVKLRPRKSTCSSCGTAVPRGVRPASDNNSVQSCGNPKPDWEKQGLIDGPSRISVMDFKKVIDSTEQAVIVDVRPKTEFGICHLPKSINIPLPALAANPSCLSINESLSSVYVICRLGNDSQVAADALRSVHADIPIKDVMGGLKAWARDVDGTFPVY